MTWNWQNGYKLFAADVLPLGGIACSSDSTYSSSRWKIHLGSNGCEVSASELEPLTEDTFFFASPSFVHYGQQTPGHQH